MKHTAMEHSELYQDIFDAIQDFLPEHWRKVVLYLAFHSGSYTIKYYVQTEAGYMDCYQTGIERIKLITAFADIYRKASDARNQLEAKHRWSVLTLAVDQAGRIHADFDYRSVDEEFIAYERDWKRKHLS